MTRYVIRLALVLIAMCVALLAMTWPYGHWCILAVASFVALTSWRGQGQAEETLEQAPADRVHSVGGGFMRAQRDDNRQRFRLALVAIAVCTGAAIYQFVG